MLLNQAISVLPFFLFIASVVAVHVGSRDSSHRALWVQLLGLTVVVSLVAGALTLIGAMWVVLAYLATTYIPKIKNQTFKRLGQIALILFLLALGMRVLPGFVSIVVVDSMALGKSAVPYVLRYELAKPIAGLLIYASLVRRAHGAIELLSVLKKVAVWLPPAILVIFTAFVIGFEIDIKLLWWAPVFIISNLFLTVLAEESFFRGLIQQPLQERYGNRYWIVIAVAIAFTLVHIPAADVDLWRFYLIIGVAGIAYAWSFQRAGKVEASILTHLIVNIGHFFLFIYPLQSS